MVHGSPFVRSIGFHVLTTGDTVGPSGLSQALRIIPIFVDIARDMEKYCPDAFLLNHSNPMSAICRA